MTLSNLNIKALVKNLIYYIQKTNRSILFDVVIFFNFYIYMNINLRKLVNLLDLGRLKGSLTAYLALVIRACLFLTSTNQKPES
jgi:hypothetical protein